MPDILHRVAIKSSPEATYRALTTREGLAGWWTTDTRGDGSAGTAIEFHFGSRGRIDMKVLEREPSQRVLWEVVRGPAEWIGTRVHFELGKDDDYTVVRFRHEGWKEPIEFMHHCSTKWATFLMSMKSLLESGQGAPYPDDVHISSRGD